MNDPLVDNLKLQLSAHQAEEDRLHTENQVLRTKISDLEQCLAEYDAIIAKYDELRTKLLLAQQTIKAMQNGK